MKNYLLLLILFVGFVCRAQQISILPYGKISSTLDRITSIGFSEKSDLLIVGDRKGGVQLWNLDKFEVLGKNEVKGSVLMAVFMSDDLEIAVVDVTGGLSFFSASSLELLRKEKLQDVPLEVSLSPDKQSISYFTQEHKLITYSLHANMMQSSINLSNRLKNALYLGYDRFGQQLAIMSDQGNTLTCNPTVQRVIREAILKSDEFEGSNSVMHAGASSKGSDLFVTSVQEMFIPKGGMKGGQPERRNSVIAYDWDTFNEVKRIRVNDRVDEIVLGPGSSNIVFYTKKRYTVSMIDLVKGAEVSSVTLDEFPETIRISDDDAFLAAGDKKGTVHLYTLERNAAPEIKIIKPSLNRSYGVTTVRESSVQVEGVFSEGQKIKKIQVNGKSADLLPGGKFSSQVNLIPGKNKIRMIAEDYESNTIFKDIYITRNFKPGAHKDLIAHDSQKKVALVVGNAAYEGTAVLQNTINDAKGMSETLESLGFEVTTIIDGSYEDIKNAIYAYGDAIKDVDVSMFFYAGHGIEVEGSNYLIPVDCKIASALDVKQKAIPLIGILRTIEYANDDGLNMIILDACRNNPFPTGRRGGAGLAKSTAPSGVLIAYSTAPGSVASDGEGENGLYTGELIKQMLVPQRIEDVFIQTRNNVESISKGTQEPWEEARLKGVFYLKTE